MATLLPCRRASPKFLCKQLHMATNLALDPDLLEEAFRVSGEPTKKAAVTRALQEFIAQREQWRMADFVRQADVG